MRFCWWQRPMRTQFVDSLVLMRILKDHASCRVCFLIAAKSLKEFFIGPMSAAMGSVPVVRTMDCAVSGPGQLYGPDPERDPTLLRGRDIDFASPQFMKGGLITIPVVGVAGPEQQNIVEIVGHDTLRIREPFSAAVHESLRYGTSYKIAPRVDNSQMFDAAYRKLADGGCIGIYPEGGSHNRPSLLPLKAGAAIIALGTLARYPDCRLTILPCGMNYFNPHKFRSRAVVEFGDPVQVSPEQVEAFKAGGMVKREAVQALLQTIEDALGTVTQQAPDHETLMLIQATRRLYRPLRTKLPLPVVIELNRRLLHGYTKYKSQPEVVNLTRTVSEYNRQLLSLGIKDHQVEWGTVRERPRWLVLATLLYRVSQLVTLSIATLPSLLLFGLVFITTKLISRSKQRKALAASSVKLQGHDVVATWKILVALVLTPILYVFYTLLATLWLHHCRHSASVATIPRWRNATTYVPTFLPLFLVVPLCLAFLATITFAGLWMGERSIDIVKSLPPLLVALDPKSAGTLERLRAQRQALASRVVHVVDTFRAELFPESDLGKLLADEKRREESELGWRRGEGRLD